MSQSYNWECHQNTRPIQKPIIKIRNTSKNTYDYQRYKDGIAVQWIKATGKK